MSAPPGPHWLAARPPARFHVYCRFFFLCMVAAWFVAPAFAQPPRGSGRMSGGAAPKSPVPEPEPGPAVAPQADTVRLVSGRVVRGYVTEQDAGGYQVFVAAGRGAYIRWEFSGGDVAGVQYAPAAARAALKRKIDWWRNKSSRDAAGKAQYSVEPLANWFGSAKAWRATGTYYAVESDVSPAMARECVWRLDAVHPEFCRVWGRTPKIGDPMRTFVFASKEGYARGLRHFGGDAAEVHKSGGMFLRRDGVLLVSSNYREVADRLSQARSPNPANRRMGNIRSLKQWRSRQLAFMTRTLYHEGYHAFVFRELRGRGKRPSHPGWMNEGFAEYLEVCRIDERGLRTGLIHNRNLPELKQFIARGEVIPLRELLVKEFRDHAHRPYPESWGLVYYLEARSIVRRNGGWSQLAGHSGKARITSFERAVGKSLAQFEPEWHDYVRGLRE